MAQRGFVSVSGGAQRKGLRPSLHVTIGTGQRCPFCHEHLDGEDPLVACSECLTVFHESCVKEGGACTTMGCGLARPEAPPQQAAAPAAAAPPAAASRARAPLPAALLVALLGLGVATWAALRPDPPAPVIVCPPPPPPPPQPVHVIVEPREPPPREVAPRVQLEFPYVQAGDSLVDVRGTIDAEGPVELSVSAPAGEVSMHLQPGPFHTTVTVGPRPGTYDIVVRVRDARGRLHSAVQRVEYRPR